MRRSRSHSRPPGAALLAALLLPALLAAQPPAGPLATDALPTSAAAWDAPRPLGLRPLPPDTLPRVSLLHNAPAPSRLRTGAVVGVGLATGAGEVYRRTQDARRLTGPFSVQWDWSYARWADKPGHLISTLAVSQAFQTGYRWAGHPPRQAATLGALSGFAWMLHYEILDGFGRREHFSPADGVANALGAGYLAARAHWPTLHAVQPKWSYWPSGFPCDATCDYEGQTVWLAVNPHALAPESARPYLPPWLNVAVGYGAREGNIRDGFEGYVVYLGLDFEPAGLPIEGALWETLLPWLRLVHLPAPALRFGPDPGVELLAY